MSFHPFPSGGICHDPSLEGKVLGESIAPPRQEDLYAVAINPFHVPKARWMGVLPTG